MAKGMADRHPLLRVCSVFVGLVLRDGVQICFRVAIQNEVGIGQRVVVDEVIQLRALEEVVRHLVLHGGAIYGVNTPIREVKFHAGGIYIERTAYELSHMRIIVQTHFKVFFDNRELEFDGLKPLAVGLPFLVNPGFGKQRFHKLPVFRILDLIIHLVAPIIKICFAFAVVLIVRADGRVCAFPPAPAACGKPDKRA